jgi:hypothetical protein
MRLTMLPTYLGVFLLSMASLAFEITLTRVFSVAQWYHFAFMTVSIALLGFGASGSFLALFPALAESDRRARPRVRSYAILAALFALSIVGSYLTINTIPFDSYRIAWERRQLLYLAIYYLSLALPFFFSGLIVGALLAAQPAKASTIYASNLAGSALGCLTAVAALPFLGGAGTVHSRFTLHVSRFTFHVSRLTLQDTRAQKLHPPISNLYSPFSISSPWPCFRSSSSSLCLFWRSAFPLTRASATPCSTPVRKSSLTAGTPSRG